jgi:predicted CoA-binding protein
MNQAIQDFVAGKRIAIVGVSRSGKKFGNSALNELKQRGYQVFVVHPLVKEIAGESCYPDLASLSGRVDGVLVCVLPEQALNVMRQAAAAGIRNVWLQQGAESPAALALARDLNLDIVTNRCILMYAAPVRSFHGWHRAFVRLTGRL